MKHTHFTSFSHAHALHSPMYQLSSDNCCYVGCYKGNLHYGVLYLEIALVCTLLPDFSLPGPVLQEITRNAKNAKVLLFKPVALYMLNGKS